jgi:hypothetical protein
VVYFNKKYITYYFFKKNIAFLLQNNYQSHKPWEFVKIFYFILLGDFGDYQGLDGDTSLNTDLYFFILFGVTIIVVIVMLNLLIAIISDSFEKVMAIEKQAEVFEKLQLILQSKRNISKRDLEIFKAKWERVYLCLLKRENTDEGDNIDERLRWKIENIIQKTSSIEASVASKAESLESKLSKTESTLISLISNMESKLESKFESKINNTEKMLLTLISKFDGDRENKAQK